MVWRRWRKRSENYSKDDYDYHDESMGSSYYHLESSSYYNLETHYHLRGTDDDYHYLVPSSYLEQQQTGFFFFFFLELI